MSAHGASGDLYDETLASVYDQMYRNPADEKDRLDFLSSVTPPGGSFCDIGAGTGSIVEEMAHRGFTAAGVDNSVAMLARFRDRIVDAGGDDTHTVDVIDDDMFTMRLDRTFDTVAILTNTFYVALTQERQLQLLTTVAAHMHQGSTLVIECFDPVRFHSASKPDLSVRYLSDTKVMIDDLAVDHAQQILVAKHTLVGSAGPEVRGHVIRYAFASEVFLLARCVGLEVTGAFRDWAGTPYGKGADRYVLAMRRSR